MASPLKSIKSILKDETAATVIEYAMIATGIALAIMATVYSVGSTLVTEYFQPVLDAFQQSDS